MYMYMLLCTLKSYLGSVCLARKSPPSCVPSIPILIFLIELCYVCTCTIYYNTCTCFTCICTQSWLPGQALLAVWPQVYIHVHVHTPILWKLFVHMLLLVVVHRKVCMYMYKPCSIAGR